VVYFVACALQQVLNFDGRASERRHLVGAACVCAAHVHSDHTEHSVQCGQQFHVLQESLLELCIEISTANSCGPGGN
jgi:hypothetical protein